MDANYYTAAINGVEAMRATPLTRGGGRFEAMVEGEHREVELGHDQTQALCDLLARLGYKPTPLPTPQPVPQLTEPTPAPAAATIHVYGAPANAAPVAQPTEMFRRPLGQRIG